MTVRTFPILLVLGGGVTAATFCPALFAALLTAGLWAFLGKSFFSVPPNAGGSRREVRFAPRVLL